MFAAEKRKAAEADEEEFGDEALLEHKQYGWHDKYRPRKPRFFNRVKTGFDWNKYKDVDEEAARMVDPALRYNPGAR